MNKTLSVLVRYTAVVAVCAFAISLPSIIHAAGTLTGTQTVANYTTINDQTDATVITQPNVVQIKAARTVLVNSIPVASTTSTIGSCVVTYSTTVADSLGCGGNAAIVNVATHNTAATLAATLQTLTSVSDATNGHGALTITVASSTADTFTTTGAEASSSPIFFADGTSGAVTAASSTTGVVAKAQKNTVTVGGTVENGDVFTLNIPTGVITYTTVASDTTQQLLANDIEAAVLATSTYSGQAFTVATTTNAVVFNAKTAGTGFTQTSSAVSTPSIAQVVTFTPSAIGGTEEYTVTINGTAYNYTDTTGILANVVTGLTSALASVPGVTCVNSGGFVTCTATSAGTPFTFSASSSLVTGSTGGGSFVGGGTEGGSGSGGGGGGSVHYTPTFTAPKVTVVTTPVTSTGSGSVPAGTAFLITKTLKYGSENNAVKALQTLLASDPTLGFTSPVTGYFGLKTKAAVEAFQVKYGIVAVGGAGYGSVGPKTRKELVTVFGS